MSMRERLVNNLCLLPFVGVPQNADKIRRRVYVTPSKMLRSRAHSRTERVGVRFVGFMPPESHSSGLLGRTNRITNTQTNHRDSQHTQTPTKRTSSDTARTNLFARPECKCSLVCLCAVRLRRNRTYDHRKHV